MHIPAEFHSIYLEWDDGEAVAIEAGFLTRAEVTEHIGDALTTFCGLRPGYKEILILRHADDIPREDVTEEMVGQFIWDWVSEGVSCEEFSRIKFGNHNARDYALGCENEIAAEAKELAAV